MRQITSGGQPSAGDRNPVTVPRGIEVLVKKAAVDPEFRTLLFDQRGAAAAAIELELDSAESAMLSVIPQEQLAQIVDQTTVPGEQRRVFLGRFAAAMVTVLGVSLAGCEPAAQTAGVRPAPTPGTKGIRPDGPPTAATNAPTPVPAGIGPYPQSTNKPPSVTTRGIQPDRP